MPKIEQALAQLFEKHRIVFWYDAQRELRSEYETVVLPGVTKIELANNEFGIKYRLLRQEPEAKFLLYHSGPRPADLDNWLLDVLLAQGEFRADQASLWLADLGLGPEHWTLVQEHAGFFQDAARRQALHPLLRPQDSDTDRRLKMLAVCAGLSGEPRLDEIIEAMLGELAAEQNQIYKTITAGALDSFFWAQVNRLFGYASSTPGLLDFSLRLFQAAYLLALREEAGLTNEALVFVNRWKDSRRHHGAFEALSDKAAQVLNIHGDLAQRSVQALAEVDLFEVIDRKMLSELKAAVIDKTLPAPDISQLIWRRRTTHWFEPYRHAYEAVDYAARFQAELALAGLHVTSLEDGLNKYARAWHALDTLYRKFIYHYRQASQPTLLGPLYERVENLYSNHYLRPLNDHWQPVVDGVEHWASIWEHTHIPHQNEFFHAQVRPLLENGKKAAVIISDALRYEIGNELMERICREDRFEGELGPMLSMLPSYTQVGMAALLPHDSLVLYGDGSVRIGGESTSGTENRGKILQQAVPDSVALTSGTLLSLNKDESRALVREHSLIYVYHNHIDATGDKRDSEERVFDAVEETLDELVELVKKLANANISNLLVTSDHGFIYQSRALDESEFASADVTGAEITLRNRRFVLGHELQAGPVARRYWVADLGMHGTVDVAIARSINRLRQQGSGSRYVHGGASLQEMVLPVLRINKKRESDVALVEVEILRSASTTITTGQVSVAFFQVQPASAKLQERRLWVGLYNLAGELISDRHELLFNFTSEEVRQREIVVRLVLSRAAEQSNNQDVLLKLEEQVPDTGFFTDYKTARYLLRRSFVSDFD